MVRLIPKSTNIKIQFYKGITFSDVILGLILLGIVALIAISNIPYKFVFAFGLVCVSPPLFLTVSEEKVYMSAIYLFKHIFRRKTYEKGADGVDVLGLIPFHSIKENYIENKDSSIFGVIEIKPTDFHLLNEERQNYLIDVVLTNVLNSLSGSQEANIVKLEKSLDLDKQIQSELDRIGKLIKNFEDGELSREEYEARINIIEDRIVVIDRLNSDENVRYNAFYLVVFDSDAKNLHGTLEYATRLFSSGGLTSQILTGKSLYEFALQSIFSGTPPSAGSDFQDKAQGSMEKDIKDLIPKRIQFGYKETMQDENTLSHFVVSNYPLKVCNAWAEELFDMPNTKVVMKLKPIEKSRAIRQIDNAIFEVSSMNKGKASNILDKTTHVETLTSLLTSLQNENETLFDVTLIITAIDKKGENHTKKSVKRKLRELGISFNEMGGRQQDVYMTSSISTCDILGISRGIQSSSIAAAFPFVSSSVIDDEGLLIAENRLPVFIDFFKRDSQHINSNLVIVGKSGSGKSYATQTLLLNLASLDSKIFILDPDGEYGKLVESIGGKVLDVASSRLGRINPFQIIASLDDENEDGSDSGFFQHLQFLEEFFKLIFQGINSDCMELINKLTLELYIKKGITSETDISSIHPKDYPTFDELAECLEDKLACKNDEYTESCLKILANYVAKFKSGGRNSALWNGESSFSTKENAVCFDFKKLIAGKNNTIANAQMLLVLKWLENEVIKNREYNAQAGANRKIVVVIDEAHVFIDEKYPIALDFMYQLGKRIRKYDGMQIVITQNIKDFTGTQEIARKSTAIINVSQYSMIFSLSPSDMSDLCELYEKAGGINEMERDSIVYNPLGTAFLISSMSKRTNISIVATPYVESLFNSNS